MFQVKISRILLRGLSLRTWKKGENTHFQYCSNRAVKTYSSISHERIYLLRKFMLTVLAGLMLIDIEVDAVESEFKG